jgi:hypothetical protein
MANPGIVVCEGEASHASLSACAIGDTKRLAQSERLQKRVGDKKRSPAIRMGGAPLACLMQSLVKAIGINLETREIPTP